MVTKNIEGFSGAETQENEPVGREKKRQNKNSNERRQKNKRGDSKVESNDSLEIPDRGKTSDISGLSAEDRTRTANANTILAQNVPRNNSTSNVEKLSSG